MSRRLAADHPDGGVDGAIFAGAELAWTDRNRVGAKAAALAALARHGFDVPSFFVVVVDAHVAGARPSAALTAHIARAIDDLDPAPHEQLAVRSSAADEDGRDQSMAGRYATILRVARNDVAPAIAEVWRSASPGERRPAVIIQRFVDAEAAGVAFGADPVSGRRGIAVVSAVRGTGDGLVGGQETGESWRVDRGGAIIERRPDSDGPPILSDALVLQIASLARRAGRLFGRPQDIEWAIEHGRAVMLQARPITALRDLVDPDGAAAIWESSNIAESYGGITLPLTFTFARGAYEDVYRHFLRLMGVSRRTIAAHATTLRTMLGIIDGRVHYNLLSWYRLLALLPGFATNRRFMEQMMGVREGLPEELASGLAATSWSGRVADRLRLAATAAAMLVRLATLGRTARHFRRRLDAALAPPEPALEVMRLDELAAAYRDLERRLASGWDAPLINDFFAMIFFGVLRGLTESWCGDPSLHHALLCGGGRMVSAEPVERIREMGRLAASDAHLVQALLDADGVAITTAIQGHAHLAELLGQCLARFGDRCPEELKLEARTLADDPAPLWRSIGQAALRCASGAGAGACEAAPAAGRRREAEARLGALLRRHPMRRLVYRAVLRQTRTRLRERENLRFERTRLFGRVRAIMLEIGRWLTAADVLDDPRDVFYLELPEVLGFIEGTCTSRDLRGLAAVRAAEHERFRELAPPPVRFETRGAVGLGHRMPTAQGINEKPAQSPGTLLQGTGCSPGRVRGRVRIVRDPRTARLDEGSILVAERTDPGWVTLLASASGVLVEHGSLLSHASILARELGVPAIVAIPGLLDRVRDGEEIEMDGATGVVHVR